MREQHCVLLLVLTVGGLSGPTAQAHFKTDQACRPEQVFSDCWSAPRPAGFGDFECVEARCVWVRHETRDPRPTCRADEDCPSGSLCTGIPNDGSLDLGKCYVRRKPSGNGLGCLSHSVCGEGLLCAELSWTNEGGTCRPDWMFVERQSSQDVPIPDHDDFGALSSLTVYGQASVPEDIMVHAEIFHPDPRELIVELVDPNGNIATLWGNEGDGTPNLTLNSLRIPNPRDDRANGRWSLRVVDTATGNVGTLLHWTLYLSTRWD